MIPACRLGGIRYGGGVNLIQVFMWNVGTCGSDDKGEIQKDKKERGFFRFFLQNHQPFERLEHG